jgi:DNA-binding transcriptional MerR regulator
MNKSPDAFRTISEVAEQLDVPAHVLRFWETRFNQVKPIKRGGGRRYYRPDDVRLLRGIRGLLYDDGLTIKGVQKILREQGVRHVIGLGTVDETELLMAAPVTVPMRATAAPVGAEPVFATAGANGGPAPLPRGVSSGGNGHDRDAGDLFEARVAVAAQDEEVLPPTVPKVHREALRRLVGKLEALRRTMTEGPGESGRA